MTVPPANPREAGHGQPIAPVPVFNCVVYVAPPNADGMVVARVVNLAGIETCGKSEREALAQAVAAFKSAVASHHTKGEPIPFVAHPSQPAPGETERLIAVHL